MRMADPYSDIESLCQALAASIHAHVRLGIDVPPEWLEIVGRYCERVDGEEESALIENGVDVMARYLTTH
jgi:hypothetical protein